MKKLFTLLAVVALFASTINAQWTNQGAFPDTSYVGGTHGIAVDPDGKIWVASYYADVFWSDDSIKLSGIVVLNADGTEADFSPIGAVATGGGFVVDTLNGHCRGLGVDSEGNILYVQTGDSKMLKINYLTGEGMARVDLGAYVSHPTGPSVSSDGTIYVGNVLPKKPIATFDADLVYVNNAVDVAEGGYSRTLEISDDGLTLYDMKFSSLKTFIYTRSDEFSAFALTDSLIGMSTESSAWNPATGKLWISNDPRGDTLLTAPAWYEFDVSSKELTGQSFTWENPADADAYARGLDFSPDGKTAYAGTYATGTPRIQKFVLEGTDVKKLKAGIPSEYNLSQNYPNPFNPTTVINFSIPQSGLVTVKVYNTLGQEVAELVNSVKAAGTFEVSFDASNLTSGMYIYKITSGKFSATKKMMLLK